MDDRVAERFGADSPGEALREHGEPAFRAAETACLDAALTEQPALVLALGGGTPTAPGAADLLGASDALLVYLRAEAPTLAERLSSSAIDRPALRGSDPAAEIGQLLAERDPLYLSLADHVIEVGSLTEPQAVQAVETLIEN